jgi:hypothetical protein
MKLIALIVFSYPFITFGQDYSQSIQALQQTGWARSHAPAFQIQQTHRPFNAQKAESDLYREMAVEQIRASGRIRSNSKYNYLDN